MTLAALLAFNAPALSAQEQQEPDIDKIISSAIDYFVKYYEDLDDVQIFLIDSTLQANYPAMMEELDNIRKSGASNDETYLSASDKWMDLTDRAFEKIFTEKQWARYMKSNYGKEKRKRDKRIEERNSRNSAK